jgi:hypothetical protein
LFFAIPEFCIQAVAVASLILGVCQAESDEAAKQPSLIPAMPVMEQAILHRISVTPP